MKQPHITKVKGIQEGTWVWCMHCERCYQAGEYREVDGLHMCPYKDCDGDTVMDSWEWESVRNNHSEYPIKPDRKKVYPLY